MLSGPVLGFQPAWLCLWTLSLLLQSRLGDDLWSHRTDARQHPDRALAGLSSLIVPIQVCCLLLLLNSVMILRFGPWSGWLYLLFLLFQLPFFPPFAKYCCLVALIDHMAMADPHKILLHVFLVAASAGAFELGHDAFQNHSARFYYGILAIAPLGLTHLQNMTLFTAASFCVSLSLLRLHSNMDRTRTRRFMTSAMAHVSAALIATSLFNQRL